MFFYIYYPIKYFLPYNQILGFLKIKTLNIF